MTASPAARKLDDLARLIDEIVRIAQPLRIVLFGSFARHGADAAHDIDLLVVVTEGTNRRATTGSMARSGACVPPSISSSPPRQTSRGGAARTGSCTRASRATAERSTLPAQGRQAARWLRHARRDLAVARARPQHPDVLLETLRSHCQQTAEKSIIAVFTPLGRRPPRTHNLVTLFESLPGDIVVPESVRARAALSGYAAAVRYADEAEDVTPIDFRRALSQAAAVLAWAQSLVDAHE